MMFFVQGCNSRLRIYVPEVTQEVYMTDRTDFIEYHAATFSCEHGDYTGYALFYDHTIHGMEYLEGHRIIHDLVTQDWKYVYKGEVLMTSYSDTRIKKALNRILNLNLQIPLDQLNEQDGEAVDMLQYPEGIHPAIFLLKMYEN